MIGMAIIATVILALGILVAVGTIAISFALILDRIMWRKIKQKRKGEKEE